MMAQETEYRHLPTPTKIQMASVVKGEDRRRRYRVNPLVALLLFAFGVIGLVMLAISIW